MHAIHTGTIAPISHTQARHAPHHPLHAELPSLIRDLSRTVTRSSCDRGRERRRARLASGVVDDAAAALRVERLIAGDDLRDVNYLSIGARRARAVCMVTLARTSGPAPLGTGFLVAPGVVMTNQHVIDSSERAASCRLWFRHERDDRGVALQPAEFAPDLTTPPIVCPELDFTLVRVEAVSREGEPLEQFGHLALDPEPGKSFIGEYLTIIQHARGERKQVCVRENRLVRYASDSPFVWYTTDTMPGSSGSPVFNDDWEVVALHHAGVPRTRRIRGKDTLIAKNGRIWTPSMPAEHLDWIANEGVRISRILAQLREHHAEHPIARAVLDAPCEP